jgi:hypothetical protein
MNPADDDHLPFNDLRCLKCDESIGHNDSYCINHRCTIPGCPFGRIYNEVCHVHSCQIHLCDKKVIKNRNFCVQHKCISDFCNNVKKDNCEYCKYNYCIVYGCLNKHKANHDTYYHPCIVHNCIFPYCYTPKVPGSELCYHHKCKLCPSLIHERIGYQYLYCDSHRCQWDAGCKNPRLSYGRYCNIHACRIPNCGIHYNGEQHSFDNICSYPGCETALNYLVSYCSKHKCQLCYYPVLFNSKYCEFHKCGHKCCNEGKHSTHLVCNKHKCLLCNELKIDGSNYCADHKCNLCEKVVENKSKYCIYHKCKLCDVCIKKDGIKYCASHSCQAPECKEYKICKYHTCLRCGSGSCEHIINFCITCSRVIANNKVYCIQHGCKWPNCIKKPTVDIFCYEHSCPDGECDYSKDCPHHINKCLIKSADYVIDGLPKDIHSIIISYL